MDSSQIVSAFPLPPVYFEQFDGNEEIKPPPLITGEYRMFGATYNTEEAQEPTLKDLGVEQLFDEIPADGRDLLKSLCLSLGYNFADLLERLASCPEKAAEKVDQIKNILVNMHYVINTFRPLQARIELENLIASQFEAKKTFSAEGRQLIDKIRTSLERIASSAPQFDTETSI